LILYNDDDTPMWNSKFVNMWMFEYFNNMEMTP
jgi:hypothetical protein